MSKSGMAQFRGTDWGEAFGNGVIRGIAIGNQYRSSKAQSDYQDGVDEVNAQYEADMEAAGEDKDKLLAAQHTRDEGMARLKQNYYTYLGNIEQADKAYGELRDTQFNAAYDANGQKDPYSNQPAMDLKTLTSFASLGGGGGSAPTMVASNGPVQGVIPAEQTQGVPTNANGTIAVKKNPTNVQVAPQQAASQYDAKGADTYRAGLLADYKKNPSSVYGAILDTVNNDPLRRDQGISYAMTEGGFQELQNGKPTGKPVQLSPEVLSRMANRYIDDRVVSKFGKAPAAGGVGSVGPTEPAAANGGQPQQAQEPQQPQQGMNIGSKAPQQSVDTSGGSPQQGMTIGGSTPQQGSGSLPSAEEVLAGYPHTGRNETITTKQKHMASTTQGFSDPANGERPTATADLQQMLAQVRGMKKNPKLDPLVKYLIQNEAKVDNYYNAYFRRFRRWPTGAERKRIVELAKLKETQRHNAYSESNDDIRTAELMRHNRTTEAQARAEAARKAMELGSTEVKDTPEKYTLGDPQQGNEERREIFGGNGLPNGYETLTIDTDTGDRPVVMIPKGMSTKNAQDAYNFMAKAGYGQPMNTNGKSEWIVDGYRDANGRFIPTRTWTFSEALKACKAAKEKATTEANNRANAARAKVTANAKARLAARHDPAAYKKLYAEGKKAEGEAKKASAEAEKVKKAMDK